MCHMIVKMRKSFQAPGVDAQRVRSHSARHTFINDLKRSEVSAEVAMGFARSKDRKTYDAYGELDEEQVGRALDANPKLRRALKQACG